VHPGRENFASRPRLFDPHLVGTFCGLASAIGYTFANAFLRSVAHCDPFWVSAVKALPTAAVMTPVLLLLRWRGQRVWPGWQLAAAIAGGGLLGQLGGNVCFQWSLDKIGVALSSSLCLGGMILAAALFGRIFLAEPVTPRALVGLSLLLAAIAVLSLGARDAGRSILDKPGSPNLAARPEQGETDAGRTISEEASSPLLVSLGVAAAAGSGVFYAALNVILRHCFLRGAPLPTTLCIVSCVGILSLGVTSWLRIGHSEMLATEPHDLILMLAAGVCNTLAFMALTKSLQLTSVVYVNALNATQVTLAAIAGVVIFREALSPGLALGIGLTISGLLLMTRAHKAMIEPPLE
jgi:drug/metabolite transporter, DME family